MNPTATSNHKQSGWREWLPPTALSLTASLIIVAPFFYWGSASGHDFEFHVSSWLDVAGQWREGILFPRWTEWANHGFGEPRFLFYPPLSWLLAPALSFFVPWTYVPVVFIVLVQTSAGISAFAFARRLLPNYAAVFAAVVYAANPNALLIIYMRSDFAELLASAFFPLLFLAALRLTGLLKISESLQTRAIVAFAVTFAAVWLSNAPAGVMVTYSMALLFLWVALAERSWTRFAYGAAGMALGFGLAGFYLVPAAYEQRWVNIGQVLSAGLLPSQNFLYTTIDDPEHNLFNWIASSTAIAMIVLTGIAALAVHRHLRQQDQSGEQAKAWRVFLLLAAAATLLMMNPATFLWKVLPKLRFVQFPWRWMSILAAAFVWFLAAVIVRSRLRWIWIATTTVVLVTTGVFFVRHTWWDADDVPALQFVVANGQGFEGTDEYDPVGDDHYNLPTKGPQPLAVILANASASLVPRVTKVTIDRWTAEEKIIRAESSEPARLALHLLNYPAWRIEINNSASSAEPPTDTNQMIVPIPAGQSTIRVHFTRTLDRTLGLFLSLLSALISGILLVVSRSQHAASSPC
jgi:6-pyruvoyl-tetrahydropterin synthase related domain